MTLSTKSRHALKALSFSAMLLCSACVGAESPVAQDGGLSTEEYLEQYCRGELPPEPERPLAPALDPATIGLTIVGAISQRTSSKFVIHDPEGVSRLEGRASGGGGSSGSFLEPGDSDFTLWYGSKKVAHRKLPARAGTQVVLIYSGTVDDPLVTFEEVDVSAPERGTRRARISNRIHDGAPLEVYYYDKDDALVAETGPIADGESWSGTIPIAAVSFRLSPEDEASTELKAGPLMQAPSAGECADAAAIGLVISERSKVRPAPCGPAFTPLYSLEVYTVHPALCDAP